jgi:hypothetical protein
MRCTLSSLEGRGAGIVMPGAFSDEHAWEAFARAHDEEGHGNCGLVRLWRSRGGKGGQGRCSGGRVVSVCE